MATVDRRTSRATTRSASSLRRRHRADRGMTILLTALMIGIGALLVWVLGYVPLRASRRSTGDSSPIRLPATRPTPAVGSPMASSARSIIVGIATARRRAVRHRLRDLPESVRDGPNRPLATARDRRDARHPDDRHRRVRVRAVGRASSASRAMPARSRWRFVMVPLIVRATEEMLRLVPRDIHEASLALGVTKSRTIVVGTPAHRQRGHHHRRDAGCCPRNGRDGAVAADDTRQRPVHGDEPGQPHVDALAADLRQRDGRIPVCSGSGLGRSAAF